MTVRRAYLNGCAAVLGERAALVAGLPEYAREPPRPGAGFDTYRVSDQPVLDLLRPALADALAAAGTRPADVDTVLLATESLPRGAAGQQRVAAMLAGLGLEDPYPVTLGFADCSTAVTALGTAAALIAAGTADTVAVLSGDLADSAEPGGRVLLGGSAVASDGAAAAVLSAAPRGWEVCGGARRAVGTLLHPGRPEEHLAAGLGLYRAVFDDLWRTTGATHAGIDAVLPSNLARDTLRLFLGEAGFAARQLALENVPRIAHCLGSDPLINLADRAKRLGPAADPCLVLLGAGAAHLSTVLLRAVED